MVKIHKTMLIGINLGDYGSTGTIMRNSLEYAHKYDNFDYLVIVPYNCGKPNTYAFFNENTFLDKIDRHFIHRVKGLPDGYEEYRATKRIIKKIKEMNILYDKVIVHLHNIHTAHISFPLLFKFLARSNIKVLYTLHDVWSYSGGCYYYDYVKCKEWQTGCKCKCCQNFDKPHFSVEKNFNLKKRYTTLFKKDQLTIVPCSEWLKKEVEKSFLKDYPIIVNNGECSIVPLDKPDLDLKKELNIENKKIILSVSAYWNDWKGYKYLYDVAEKLPENYVLLVIGSGFNSKGYKNVIHIPSVQNGELNKYYSIADCFISVTQDDNLPLVLMEAQICGVPVVGFGHGGTPEEIIEGKTGTMIGLDNDVDKICSAIVWVIENKPFKSVDIKNNGNKFKSFESAKRMLKIYKTI